MSSLKDIMDVDVEPLESQAYRRSKEAASTVLQSLSLDAQSSTRPLSPLRQGLTPDDTTASHHPLKTPERRCKSTQVSKVIPNSRPPAGRSSTVRRRSSAAARGDAMDYPAVFQMAGPLQQESPTEIQQMSPRGVSPAPALPVKYTPVTGRISRAKKGVPVHTCDICRPVKTFTRAEHLRRHQLSHRKPAYPCTFPDCERAFHRLDLLQRHISRHEIQGERRHQSGEARSRASSLESQDASSTAADTPRLFKRTQSPTAAITARDSSSGAGSMTASSYASSKSAFQPDPYTPGASPRVAPKRSASEAQLSESERFSQPSPRASSSGAARSYRGPVPSSNYAMHTTPSLGGQDQFMRSASHGIGQVYSEGSSSNFNDLSPSTQALPLLRIPEETYLPSLAYAQDNSPWCSSASDSTYSNSEGSRTGRLLDSRARSTSIATVTDWSAPASVTQWTSSATSNPSQNARAAPYDMLEQYGDSYIAPPLSTRQRLDVPASTPSLGGYYIESVGTALSAYKPVAQQLSASTPPISHSGLGSLERGSKALVGYEHVGPMVPPTQTARLFSDVSTYVISFWKHFDPHFPIIHRTTKFEENNLLTYAMAALGTQYHNTADARQSGAELNDFCRRAIDLCPVWNLQTMQAILLTELFTRFRGRKTTILFSRQFEDLYDRLLNTEVDVFLSSNDRSATRALEIHSQWSRWIEAESRQRLLSLCFIFDVHQAFYLEQSRLKTDLGPIIALLILPCPEALWSATGISEWHKYRSKYTMQPLRLIQEQMLVSSNNCAESSFSETLLICSFAARLPSHIGNNGLPELAPDALYPAVNDLTRLFPASVAANTYLALHYTPLHYLLAVAGDTWVFAKKITPPSAFHAARTRLKAWSQSLVAAYATQYACRVLHTRLSEISAAHGSDQTSAVQGLCVTDYWGLYTAALVCWAFGQRYHLALGHRGLGLQRNNATSQGASPEISDQEQARSKALLYTRGMLELDTADLLTNKATMRGDIAGVLEAVRLHLEAVSVGDKCMMLVDAVCVLRRIGEGAKVKWF